MPERAAFIDRGPLDNTTDIETPEHIRFRHRAAGPSRRGLAYLLDALIRGAVLVICVMLLAAFGLMGGGELGKASGGLILLVLFAVEWGYYVFFETLWSGRTPGKRAVNLRVIKNDGTPINFVDSVLRNLLRAADALPSFSYALALVVMARDERFRRLGDLVGGTMVVVEERARVSAPVTINPPPSPQELEVIPQRPPLSAEDVEAIELFLRRYGTLAPAREAELAAMVAPIYGGRMGLRYYDATRFLALLYHRSALEKKT
ncbi:MAG TPA: RDD family protein [Polyangia bacterium]|nr:RDD family protein [Polyangia bacterium]